MNNELYYLLNESVVNLWRDMISIVPELITALLVLILGWIIGGMLAKVVRHAFKKLHIDDALDKAGVDDLTERAGLKFKPGHFVGLLTKWFVILAFLMVSFDILGFSEVNTFMREVVLNYLPQVIVAVLILFAAFLVAGMAGKALSATLTAAGTNNPEMFGRVAKYTVIVFGVMAALVQLGIAKEMMQTLFTGVVFALSLGLGLAFGLGGKDAAARFIDGVTNKDKHHH